MCCIASAKMTHRNAKIAAFATALLVAGCSGPLLAPFSLQQTKGEEGRSSASPIQHVVIIIQENRTFNDFFATYPGADGSTTGRVLPSSASNIKSAQTTNLRKSGLDHHIPGLASV